jgi:hypothetical protein
LKEENKVATQWAKDKKQNDERLLKEVEARLETLFNSEGFGFLTKA